MVEKQPAAVVDDSGELCIPIREVARRLGMAESTVRDMGADGRLPAPIRFGKLVRWRVRDLERFIEGKR